MDKNKTPFGEKLRKARKLQGISALELGQRCGIFPNLIYRLETSETDPRLSTVMALAEGLGISVTDLLSIR